MGHVGGMGIDADIRLDPVTQTEGLLVYSPLSLFLCSKQFQRIMTKQGLKFKLNTKVSQRALSVNYTRFILELQRFNISSVLRTRMKIGWIRFGDFAN